MRGKILVWLAVLVYALASSVVAKLVLLGEENLIDGRNPISFCNVLFAGNLVASITLFILFRKDFYYSKLKKIRGKDWLGQLVLALLVGAIAPSLMFTALDRVSVSTVVLVETFEIPLFLFFTWLILKDRHSQISIIGAFFTLLGVLITIFLSGGSSSDDSNSSNTSGVFYALSGTTVFVLGSIFAKRQLSSISLGLFATFRNFVGAIFFAIIVLYLFGAEHFIDIFSPFLWKWTLLYGALIVVGGQLLWFSGIKICSASNIALANAFSPIAGIFFAFLILGEIPNSAQILGGLVILVGIGVGLYGELKSDKKIIVKENKPKAFIGV